jgi:6-pyruvoyltetrahydropterin/6-carboxytetrahydropterin synthase
MANFPPTNVFELRMESARDLKFSAAHFTAHGGTRERLHGHNYTLSVAVRGAAGADGCVVEFSEIKVATRALAAELDERFLCAELSTTVVATVADGQLSLRVAADGSAFSMPVGDAVLLPLRNTTVEELSAYLARGLVERIGAARLLERGVTSVTLGVAESPGQEARCTIDVK